LSEDSNDDPELSDTWLFLTAMNEVLNERISRMVRQTEPETLWGDESALYCGEGGQCAADVVLFSPPLLEEINVARYPMNRSNKKLGSVLQSVDHAC
jgi:hypothetical protein